MSEELDFSKLSLDDVSVGGQKVTTDPAPNAEPVNNAEPATDPVKADTVTDPAPAADPAKVEPAAPVEPAKVESAKVEPSKEPAKTEPTAPSFKDDFIKGVVEYYEKTGDLTPYLQAKLVDFQGMSDEEIMRRDLREAYPDVSDKAFEKLYKQQVIDKYKLDAEMYEEDDIELGKELLKSEASKIRSKYQEWQKGFQAPEPEPDNSSEEEARLFQEFEEKVKNNELTKAILNDKRIAIKTADGDFNFEIQDPNALLDMTIDNDKFFSQFASGEGEIDYAKWYKTSAYAQNPEQFERSLINYGKTLGREEITKEIKNPSTNTVGDIPTEGSGDFTTGLLQAFASRGVSK